MKVFCITFLCCIVSVFGSSDFNPDKPETYDGDKCMCGRYLGLFCSVRAEVDPCVTRGREQTLYGKGCEKKAFYQCSEINYEATFKGFCPNCRVNYEDIGRDVCLSPTLLKTVKAGECMCGNWLGLHCGLRAEDHNCDPDYYETTLFGDCEAKAFYQCSEIQTEATFKGFCPNCRLADKDNTGRDACLSPTFRQFVAK